jgi:DNA-binding IclR family transcriptional regulator
MSSSAIRALRILEAIASAGRPPGVTEIARMLKSTPGTVFRGLDALARAGLIARYQSSSRYVLGPTADRLRHSLLTQFRIREVSLPYLRQLASLTGETASLHVRLGWYALRIASIPGTNEVTDAPPIGEAHALGTTYAGRAILAFLSAREIAAYRAWAKRHSGTRETSKTELQTTAQRGFALGEEEFAGRCALALPLRAGDFAIASLAIEGPAFDGSRAAAKGVASWREIADKMESVFRAQPALCANPFDHVDPDAIAL